MKRFLLASAIVLGCFSSEAFASTVLIGTSDGTVGTLDTTTLIVSNSFDVGGSLLDIAIDNSGKVFGSSGGASLISINTVTQTSSFIGLLNNFINALAFNSNNTLFGAGGGSLFSINTTTGTATAIGSIGGSYSSSGDLAFGPGGVLYGTSKSGCGANTDCLFSINTTTGVGTLVGQIGLSDVFGLAFSDGVMYGIKDINTLISISLATGSGTVLGSYTLTSRTFGATAAAPVPIPAALPLLAAGLGAMGLTSRRKKRKAALAA